MNRIAVLISGEYRTFDHCRRTMWFLDNDNVDVYFSTWDKSIQVNARLKIDLRDDVTLDRINAAMGTKKLAGCIVEPHVMFGSDTMYNVPMIHRWQKGLELIEASNVNYDFIVIYRPDLIFNNYRSTPYFNDLNDYLGKLSDNVLYSIWCEDAKKQHQDDVVLMARPNVIKQVIADLPIDRWQTEHRIGWHTWFYHHVINQGIDSIKINPFMLAVFCRANCPPNASYYEAFESARLWRYAVIEDQIQRFGRHHVQMIWGEHIFAEMERHKLVTFSKKLSS